MRVAVKIQLSDSDRRKLDRWSRSRSVASRLQERSQIILMAADGQTNKEIARTLGIDENKVGRWRNRFTSEGINGIKKERPRGGNYGGKCSELQAKLKQEVILRTTQTKPQDATHWSIRSMAREVGTSQGFVQRVWKSCGLKPHLIRTFKVSNDPHFEEKLQDVVGLYMNPPKNAVVFSFDEKSSIQALDRTQPGLPLKKGHSGTMTHDYKRHGTTNLFLALQLSTGKVIGEAYKKHRHQEVLRFLKKIEKTVPKGQEIHIILDNYSTHKHAKVLEWIERKKRIFMHFIPTSSSWLNLVERFFRTLTEKQLRRGVFCSVAQLEQCIHDYLEIYNKDPKPLVWTKPASEIISQVKRAKEAVNATIL